MMGLGSVGVARLSIPASVALCRTPRVVQSVPGGRPATTISRYAPSVHTRKVGGADRSPLSSTMVVSTVAEAATRWRTSRR